MTNNARKQSFLGSFGSNVLLATRSQTLPIHQDPSGSKPKSARERKSSDGNIVEPPPAKRRHSDSVNTRGGIFTILSASGKKSPREEREKMTVNIVTGSIANLKVSRKIQQVTKSAKFKRVKFKKNSFILFDSKSNDEHEFQYDILDLGKYEILNEILNNKKLKKALEQFCIKEWSQENFYFLEHVSKYRQLKTLEEKRKMARWIVKEFVHREGSQPLNISHADIKKIMDTLEYMEMSNSRLYDRLFDDLEKKIRSLISDTVIRFISQHKKQNL